MSSKPQRQPEPEFDPEEWGYAGQNEPEIPEIEEDVYPAAHRIPVRETMPYNEPLAFADEQMRRLALALNFGPEDLTSNLDGELSPDQIAQLHEDLRQFYWPMIGGLALLAFVLGAMGAFAGELLAFPVLALMALAVVPAWLLKQERERLPERRVQRTLLRMGTLSLVARRWGLHDDKTLPVADGKPIFAPKALYRTLQANRTYILYYTPVRTWRGYRLLSIETAQDDSPPEKAKHKPKRGS